MPNPAGFYSFVVPRPPGTNCKARRSVSISTSIHLTKDAAEISNKVSCRLLYELRFFVMINYDFQKTAVYKNCGSFGLFIGLLRCLYLEQKLFLDCLYLKRKNEKPAILADSSLMEITWNFWSIFYVHLHTCCVRNCMHPSSKHSFHDYGVCSKLLKVHKMWKITSLFLSKSHAFWGFKMHSIYSRECERGERFTFKNIFPIWSFDISQLEIENPEFQSMIRSRKRINKCILKQIFHPTSKNSISYFTAKCGLTPQQTFAFASFLTL